MQHEDRRETDKVTEMELIARSYFQQLFSAGRRGNYEHILSGVTRCISDEDDTKLKEIYTNEEIQKALADLGPTKALGEDGFQVLFYQKCWAIIGEDVTNFCLSHLNGVLNGYSGEFFFPSRGLRQEDPLSPFLFLFCGEGLSSLMNLGLQDKKEGDRRAIARILGVRSSNDLKRYLGLPNVVGRRKKEAFQNLKDRLKKRIDNWSVRYLSQGGKEVTYCHLLRGVFGQRKNF
ncbi:hypothetical protein J1N35_019540 [Gossypium stocksii]|uniref:Reverse transcriptase n=1 Tax=Gossypium stocksii TaxID=47602 RepID=A0A9D3VTE6_9ROSI|nr:hypothetical protein J1N35_019540 [Gossypium stocksii]